MTGFLRVVAVLVVTAWLLGASPAQAATSGLVSRVVDGDTVEVYNAGRTTTVRVLGIDTPETKDPRKPVQCGGPEATSFAREALLGQQVAVVADPTQAGTDRYGRLLGELVKPDGWNYSVEAARAGVAYAYPYSQRPPQVYAQVVAAQREAQAAQRGVWGEPCWGER